MKCLICDMPNDHTTEECPYGDGLEPEASPYDQNNPVDLYMWTHPEKEV